MLYNKYASFIHIEYSRFPEALPINLDHTNHQDSQPTLYASIEGMSEDWMISDFTILE